MANSIDGRNRCFGNGEGKAFYATYHDDEWGVPVYDDQLLFEMLILEGAQAGLSWETVLKKKEMVTAKPFMDLCQQKWLL